MAYFPVDDDLAFHPKVLAAGNEAMGMWTRAGALCKKHTTGGFVTTETARALGPKKAADRLVAAGLWVPVEGGYQFHDWTAQTGNGTAEEERARKERMLAKNAERQARWRQRQRERDAESNAVTNGAGNSSVTPSPSPSPSPTTEPIGLPEVGPDPAARERTDLKIALPEDVRLAAFDMGIRDLHEVVVRLAAATERPVTGEAALAYSRLVLSRAAQEPTHPGPYILAAIDQHPDEAASYIDWAGLAA
ncbi:hypothetical protein K8F61_17290 [Microbacterium resistens]|uniref:Uncharacterized protein n=1 Tax=Microbacterium resistens TaxID=156977 RepID=A0ABY3RTY0_9MICO|nr:hypothetical protein [Microbacterium resistens]UGS26359.1 hypothetical protein K8F61_17290 [Microbacterium resistens]